MQDDTSLPIQAGADALDASVLHDRRIVLVEQNAARADAMARALRQRGAHVLVLDGEGRGASGLTIDADVIVVDLDGIGGWAVDAMRRVRRDPRLRWASLVAVRAQELWPPGARQPDLGRLACAMQVAIEPDDALTRRAGEPGAWSARLEVTGPARLLRALARARGISHVTVRHWGATVSIDLAEGLIVGARAHMELASDAGRREVAGTAALAVLVALGSGSVRVEPRDAPSIANVMAPVDDALAAADRDALARRRCTSLGAPDDADGLGGADLGVSGEELDALLAQLRADGDELEHADPSDVVWWPDASPAPAFERPPAILDEAPAASSPVPLPPPPRPLLAPPALAAPRRVGRPRGRYGVRIARAAMVFAGALVLLGTGARSSPSRAQPDAVHASASPSETPHRAQPAPVAMPVELARDDAPAPAGPRRIELEPLELRAVLRDDAAGALQLVVDRANLSRARGNFFEAEADYLRVLEAEPAHTRAMAGLTRLYMARPDARAALEWAQRLVTARPAHPANHVLLGDVLELGGDPEGARRAWQRAATLDPGHRAARRRLERSGVRP